MPEPIVYKRLKFVKKDGRNGELFNIYGVVMRCVLQRSADAVGRAQDEYRLILNDGDTMHVTVYTAPDHIPANTIAVGKVIRLHRLTLATFNVAELQGEKYLRGRVGGITSILVFDRPDDEKPGYVSPPKYTWESMDQTILRQITRIYRALMKQSDNPGVSENVQPAPVAGPSGNAPQPVATASVPPPATPQQAGAAPEADVAASDGDPANDAAAEDVDLAQLTRDMDAYRFRNIHNSGGVHGYYDFVCEVAGIYYGRDVVYLACFDGTRPSMRLRTEVPDLVPRDVNEDLIARANVAGLLVYVCLYDNNMAEADNLMPGDIVWIVNAHVYMLKAVGGYMIVMHKYNPLNNPFNRQVTKMDVDSVQYRAARTVFNAAKAKLPPVVMPVAAPATNAVTPAVAAGATAPRLNAFTPPRAVLTPPTATVPGGAVPSSARRRILPEAAGGGEGQVQQQQPPPQPADPVHQIPPQQAAPTPVTPSIPEGASLNNSNNASFPSPLTPAASPRRSTSKNNVNAEPQSSSNIQRTPTRALARRPISPFRGPPIVDTQMIASTSGIPNAVSPTKDAESIETQASSFSSSEPIAKRTRTRSNTSSTAEPIAKRTRTPSTTSPTTEPIAKRTRTRSNTSPTTEPIAKRTRGSANSSPNKSTVSGPASKTKKAVTPKKRILTFDDLEEVTICGSQSQENEILP